MIRKFSYIYDNIQNYAVYELSEDEKLNDFWLNMIEHSKIDVLNCIYCDCDGFRQLRFPVSNMISLEKHIMGKEFDVIEILELIEQLALIIKKSIKYLFNPNNLIFDISYMYFDYRISSLKIIYMPIDTNTIENKMEFDELIKSIIDKISLKSNTNMIEKLYDYTTQSNFCVEGLLNLINQFKVELKQSKSDYKNQYREIQSIKNEDLNKFSKEEIVQGDRGVEIIVPRESLRIKEVGRENNFAKPDIEKLRNLSSFSTCKEVKKIKQAKKLSQSPKSSSKLLKQKKKGKKKIEDVTINYDVKKIVYFVGINLVLLTLFILIWMYIPYITGDLNDSKYAIILLYASIVLYIYIKFFHKKLRVVEPYIEEFLDYDESEQNFSDNISSRVKDKYRETLQNFEDYSREEKQKIQDEQNWNKFTKNELSSKGKNSEIYFETEILSDIKKGHKIINEKTGEVIYINKNSYKIGRQEEINDYKLDRKTVGRYHAEIIQDDENAFILDLGSKNGTFLNNKRLLPYTEYKLCDNDIFNIADVKFIYKKYAVK